MTENKKRMGIVTALTVVAAAVFGPDGMNMTLIAGAIIAALVGMKFTWGYVTSIILTGVAIFLSDSSVLFKAFYFFIFLGVLALLEIVFKSSKPSKKKARREKYSPPKTGRGGVTEHGVAGSGIGGNSKFSSYNTEAGAKGERMTAANIKNAFANDTRDVHLFNSVKFLTRAMRSEADVDHVLVVGKQAFLIDSKLFARANYKLVGGDKILATFSNGGTKVYKNSMASALKNFRTKYSSTGLKFTKTYIIVHGTASYGFSVTPGQVGDVFLGDWSAVIADMKRTLGRGNVSNGKVNSKHITMLNSVRK